MEIKEQFCWCACHCVPQWLSHGRCQGQVVVVVVMKALHLFTHSLSPPLHRHHCRQLTFRDLFVATQLRITSNLSLILSPTVSPMYQGTITHY